MKKKIPQESKKTEEKNPQKFSAYDVARTCVMDVFQHTPIWFVRERERERERDGLHAANINRNFLRRRMKH